LICRANFVPNVIPVFNERHQILLSKSKDVLSILNILLYYHEDIPIIGKDDAQPINFQTD